MVSGLVIGVIVVLWVGWAYTEGRRDASKSAFYAGKAHALRAVWRRLRRQ